MENFKFKSSLFHSVHNPQGIFIHILINSGLMWKMCWNYFILLRFSELRKWQCHMKYCDTVFCMRIVPIWSFSGPYFPTFARNTEGEILRIFRIQSRWGEIQTRKTPNTSNFHAVRYVSKINFSFLLLFSLSIIHNSIYTNTCRGGFLP